jgi:tRNA A37 N6-isopentenylltransferase MiaA
MPEEQKPMLNTPAETDSAAAEEFKKNLIARMDRAHEAHAQLNRTLAESPEHAEERVQKFKQEFIAHFSEMTGLSFSADGRCTTPGEVKMEGEVKERWTELCKQLGENQDPQKSRQLWQEAGKLLREATQTPEVKPTSADRTTS